MPRRSDCTLVVAANFIEASRDAGYKNVASALGELIDNAFEADASSVRINITRYSVSEGSKYLLSISDNGRGMTQDTCRNSLRFGWSSRFNQRSSHGRYGMGLPNASLSQARRVDIMSSRSGRSAVSAYLDADEFRKSGRETVPGGKRLPISHYRKYHPFKRGTTVSWSKCDRLDNRKLAPLVRRLRIELGRIFRYQLWGGKRIAINGEYLRPIDPLFERSGAGLTGAISYGPELAFEILLPNSSDTRNRSSMVRVRFTELPVADWHSLSNEKKNAAGIAKRAGVSIVRAGREIDYGWFFMGQKRRENYDDWWRCEVRFEPVLDELFGVTHTKQVIQPSEKLLAALTPDVELIARELNTRDHQ
jgi:Histidine kinase-, DNA gyrase B-, and HSP90-like ATPase